jgi:Bacterial regulatory protein, Fis family
VTNPDFISGTHYQRIVRIHRALLLCGGNQRRASKMLGIERTTLYRECKLHDRLVAEEIQQTNWNDDDVAASARGATAQKMSNAAPAGRSYRSEPTLELEIGH